jgi:hypothetical protein
MRLSQFVRLAAGLAGELTHRFDSLFAKSFDPDAALEETKWLKDTFHFDIPKTPKGGKELKALLQKFRWFLDRAAGPVLMEKRFPGEESGWKEAARIWKQELRQHVDEVARLFSAEGGTVVPKDLKIGQRVYLNLVGLNEKALQTYAKALEQVFAELKGWRRKALDGTLHVALAGPEHFRGTVGGKYKSDKDTLMVRATPKVLKRTKGTYGAFDYIIVHELGHRYERKHPVGRNFDSGEWHSSRYSRNEGEAFAELFALSNFGMTRDASETWDASLLEKFDKVMA